MACNLVTNRARSLRSLIDSGIVDNNLLVQKEPEFIEANINKTKELEVVLGSSIPNATFAYGLDSNFVQTNDELFQRADAAEGIIYAENEQYKDNFAYPVLEKDEYNPDKGDAKLTELLKNIGVNVSNITENPRFKNVGGAADVFHKVAYTSINKDGVNTLPEEAAHMFVEFIEQNSPALFNKMMANIPKYGIYSTVKQDYFPIYNDINLVKKEAIGKAISEYLVGNTIDKNEPELRSWFDQVLNFVKNALAKFGINTFEDYNNYFEITADKILKGDFQGTFKGNDQVYLNLGEEDSPLKRIDAVDASLELRRITENGKETSAYFINGRRVKYRVTEKIRDKNKTIVTPNAGSTLAMEVGTNSHEDLMNLWKIKAGEKLAENVVPKNPSNVFSKLATFVEVIANQFPGATFRTEVKIHDPKSDTAGTIDLMVTEPDGTVNIFDYKFMQSKLKKLPEDYSKQLGEYRRILKTAYDVKKFGQIRVLPFQVLYSGKLENKVLQDIDMGTNSLQSEERNHLNPFPTAFETTKDERINRSLQFLNEELGRNEASVAQTDIEKELKTSRTNAIRQTIARLQITRDITSLESIASEDKTKMEHIMNKANPSPNELIELYTLKNYYEPFISKKYNIDNEGNQNIELTEIAVFAQEQSEAINNKLEEFFNQQSIDTGAINKPLSWWSQFTQLSDYDNPAFQAFYKLINKGFAQTEIKVKKEYQEIKDIVDQIRKDEGKSGIDMYDKILQKDANGKYTNKLISKNSKEWYDMHTAVKADPKLKSTLTQYFDTARWNEYYKPLETDFLARKRVGNYSEEEVGKALLNFKAQLENSRGIGNANSTYFNIPDKFLNPAYLENVKNKPDSGLAKLYNKYVEINRYANANSDANVSLTLLPYVRKSTIEMLAAEGFNFKNLTNNALDKLKSYDWETVEFDSNGEKIYKIPLKFKGTSGKPLEDQSHDLGEMLMLWSESVYNNSYLQETHSTAKLYQLALKASKEVSTDNLGNPIWENGELKAINTSSDTMQKYQEYLNMYYYGIKNEDKDFNVLGYSGQKIVKTAMQYLSGKAIGFNIFSGFANITGGLTQAISIGSKGSQFNKTQLFKAVTSLHDPKMRSLFSLMDVTNNQFQKEKAINLSANKSESFVTWDKLYILQQGGDWLIQNSTLGAMAQNYTIDDKGKIVKKTGEEKSLVDSLNFDKDGKVVIDGFDLNKEENYLELLKFREKVRRVAAEISGNTSEHDKFLAGNTLKGQLMLQFRRWILPMANSRFQQLKYSANLEEYQIGKYKSTAQALINKNLLNIVQEYIKDQNSPTLDKVIFERYETAKALNPKLTYEEFKKLYVSNMHSTFTELALLSLLSSLGYAMDDDDDTEQGLVNKILSRGLARTASELSFWYNTDSFTSIIQAPIPLIGLVTDMFGLVKATSGSGIDLMFGNEDEKRKVGDKIAKLIPGVNAYYKLLKDLDEE